MKSRNTIVNPDRAPSLANCASAGLRRIEQLDAWVDCRRRRVLVAIVLIATAVRVAYFLELNAGPLRILYWSSQMDTAYYNFWAKQINAGDFLSKNIPLPLHVWHIQTADEWLRINPDLNADLRAQAVVGGITDSRKVTEYAERAVWKRWVGANLLYQEPAYPYLVALTYRIFGDDPRYVFGWQMLLGVGTAWLVCWVTFSHFGALQAAVAGLFAALVTPSMMYEGTLLRDPLITFLAVLLIFRTDLAMSSGRVRSWLLLGLCAGGALLVKGTFMLYLLGVLVYVLFTRWRDPKQLGKWIGALITGVFIALSPLIARNVIVGAPALALAGKNAVPSFIIHNLPAYRWSALVPQSEHEFPRILGEADGSLLRGIALTLKTHPHVWTFPWILLQRFDASFHWWDRPDNADFYFYQLYADSLRKPITFWTIATPGLLGLLIAIKRFRRHIALYLIAGTFLAQLMLFGVMGRYRLPMLMALCPFAGVALVQTIRWLLDRKPSGAICLAALVVIGCWTGRPLDASINLIRHSEVEVAYYEYYQRLSAAAPDDARWQVQVFSDFLDHAPPDIGTFGPDHPPDNDFDDEYVMMFAAANTACYLAEQRTGNPSASTQRRAEDVKRLAAAHRLYLNRSQR